MCTYDPVVQLERVPGTVIGMRQHPNGRQRVDGAVLQPSRGSRCILSGLWIGDPCKATKVVFTRSFWRQDASPLT